MYYNLSLPDNTQISIKQTPFGRIKVMVNGQTIPMTNKSYAIPTPNGTKELIVKNDMIGLSPKAIVDNQTYELTRPLKWHEYVAGGIPFLWIVRGGAIGAVCGLYSMYYNYGVIRSNYSKQKKIALVSASTIGSFLAWIVLGLIFYSIITTLVE